MLIYGMRKMHLSEIRILVFKELGSVYSSFTEVALLYNVFLFFFSHSNLNFLFLRYVNIKFFFSFYSYDFIFLIPLFYGIATHSLIRI